MEASEFEAVAVIPTAITMVVGEGFRRRIIIPVHMLDHTFRIQDAHSAVGGLEKRLLLRAGKVPVRLATGVGKRLVDIADDDVAVRGPPTASRTSR
jgi:hypothetical protein